MMNWFFSSKEEKKKEEKQTEQKFASFAQKLSAVDQFAHQKVSWHAVPEHEYDALPVGSEEETKRFAESLPRISIGTLLSLTEEGEMKELGELLVEQLNKHGVVVLKLDEKYKKICDDFNRAIKLFFDQSVDEKMAHRAPGEKRSTYSGYSTIIFDNRDSIREPEARDIFQMRLAEAGLIPWPTPDIQQTATDLYTHQFNTSLQLLACLSLALGFPVGHLSSLLDSSPSPSPATSQNTNMCAFHYWDQFGYKSEQRCMIHQDRGLVTLLPPPSAPGLHLLDRRLPSPSDSQWLSLDKETAEDEMLFYTGLSLEYVSSGRVPSSFHRVVRQPGCVRYSCPFEAKPYDTCLLTSPPSPSSSPSSPSFANPLPSSTTAKDLYVQADWERINSKVARQESVHSSTPSPSPSSSSSSPSSSSSSSSSSSPSSSPSIPYEEMDKSCFPLGREEIAMMVDGDA